MTVHIRSVAAIAGTSIMLFAAEKSAAGAAGLFSAALVFGSSRSAGLGVT